MGLAKAYAADAQHGSAYEVLHQVMSLSPSDVDAKCLAANALLSAGNAESLAVFEEALELDPQHVTALRGYGLALKTLDEDLEGAEAAYRTALRVKVRYVFRF